MATKNTGRLLIGAIVLFATGSVGGWYAANWIPAKRLMSSDEAKATPAPTPPADTDIEDIKAQAQYETAQWFEFVLKGPLAPRTLGKRWLSDSPPQQSEDLADLDKTNAFDWNIQRAERIEALSKLIEKHKDGEAVRSAYADRGCLRSRNKEYEAAIADFTVAIRMGDTGAYLDRADVRMKAGQYDQAIADYTKVIEYTDTRNSSVSKEKAYYHRALAHAMNSNAHNCRDDFRLAAQSRREQQAKDKK
ncbi:MAG TPA: hypothetical protein VHR66_23940 [Gemmataceae bacterium]|nr:hypothetical protein [Gemmataceae bacterium]